MCRREWMKRHKSTHQGNNKFISAQRQVLLKTYHPPEEICRFLLSAEVRASCMRKHVSSGQIPAEAPHDSGFPAKRSEFPLFAPPAPCSLLSLLNGLWVWDLEWQAAVETNNNAEGIFLIPFRCESHHRETPAGVWVWKTPYLLLFPIFRWGLFLGHRGKPRSWGKRSRFQPHQVSHLFERSAPQHQCPDYRGWRHRHDLPGFMSSHAGGITWAISWYQHFLPPPLSGSSRPSWGIPQPPQAFLGKSPVSQALPGGVPSLTRPPGDSPTSGSFLRAHGTWEATDSLIPGSHAMSCKLTPYNSVVSAEIPGPGPSNSISHFAPTFWVLWWWSQHQPRVQRSERDPRGESLSPYSDPSISVSPTAPCLRCL